MKSFLFASALIASLSVSVQADMMKKALIDLSCVETGVSIPPRTFSVTSDEESYTIHFDDNTYPVDSPLIAGTEGSDPYLQIYVVDSSRYNISISGEDFSRAFYDSVAVEGTAMAYVSKSNFGRVQAQRFSAQCEGRMEFTDYNL